MTRRFQYLAPACKASRFYAYVLRGVLNLQWSIETMNNPALLQVVKDYLSHVCEKEWDKGKILALIKKQGRNSIREESRRLFPSLFEGRRLWPLAIPKELPNIKLDVNFIEQLRTRIMEETMEPISNEKVINKPRTLPAGVMVDQLTLENYSTLTGKRFRVTTEQKMQINAGTLTREQAFAEFVKELQQ